MSVHQHSNISKVFQSYVHFASTLNKKVVGNQGFEDSKIKSSIEKHKPLIFHFWFKELIQVS